MCYDNILRNKYNDTRILLPIDGRFCRLLPASQRKSANVIKEMNAFPWRTWLQWF